MAKVTQVKEENPQMSYQREVLERELAAIRDRLIILEPHVATDNKETIESAIEAINAIQFTEE